MARGAVNRNKEDFEEGDCRYLAQEVLTHQYKTDIDFTKADIFSLGISVYEMITGDDLPLNGEKWSDLRKNRITMDERTIEYTRELKELVREMMEEDYEKRPTAEQIL